MSGITENEFNNLLIMSKESIDKVYMMRRDKNLKLKEIAEGIGKSVSLLSHLFNHQAKVSPETWREIVSYVLSFEDVPTVIEYKEKIKRTR